MNEPLWAKPAVSFFAMGIFVAAFVIAYLANDKTSLTLLMGVAGSMGTTVVNYWVGSSAGSDKKTELLSSKSSGTP